MRSASFFTVAAAALLTLACGAESTGPTQLDETLVVPVAADESAAARLARNFRAPGLKGRNEVPPNGSKGAGAAIFRLSEDALSYRLIVANIEDVTQAHIHVGPEDDNGPVVAFLFGFVQGGVNSNGILAEGEIEATDLVGPLAGRPLSDLIAEMRQGNTYVNVHTVALPPGEIRAHIR